MTDHPKSVGSYEIRRQLGEGGMGSVYLAIDPMIGRPVDVKLIREGVTSPELRERFNREAQSAGNLNHPNIVTIYQLGDHDGQPFIVMEYVSGRTLSATIAKRTSLPLVEKPRIMEQLCSGLAYAHAAASSTGTESRLSK